MEIQQHDGVVVEAAGISAGLCQAQREGERCHRREREAPEALVRLPSLPPLYIGVQGAQAPRDPISSGGGGQGGGLAPQVKWGAPHP